MKAIGKTLGLIILVLFLLVVAALFAITHIFDPNDYKDEIRQLARDKANLELDMRGDIGWSLFPWLGIELTDTTVASANTPDQPLADVRQLGLSVRVLPLLRKEVQMSDVRVDGLSLHLSRDQNGVGNWENIGAPAEAEATAQASGEPATTISDQSATAETADGKTLQLDIDSLTVSNARLEYSDAQSGQHLTVENLNLTTGAVAERSDIPVKFSATVTSSDPFLRANTNLQGDLRFDTALQRFQFSGMKLDGDATGDALNGKQVEFSAQGELLADLAAGIAEWNGLKFTANQMSAMGEIKIHDLDSDMKLAGGLSIAAFNLRDFLSGIGVELPASQDAKALSLFEMSNRFSGTVNSVQFSDLTMKLDDTTFTGSLGIADFEKMALRAQLKGDAFNLDRYLPPSDTAATEARQAEVKDSIAKAGTSGTTELPQAPTQQAWSSEKVLPIDTLRGLDLQLGLTLNSLQAMQETFSNITVKATAAGGRVSLDDFRAVLHGGNLSAKASVDVRQADPKLSLNAQVARMPVEPFIATEGEPSPLKGTLDLNANFTTSGNSQRAWVNALNGNAGFTVTDGVLVGANLEQQLCIAISVLNGKRLSNPPSGKDTPFQELKGNLNVRNGVASNPDLKVSIPGLSVSGKGDLDLRVLGLDYRIGILLEGDQRQMPDPACQINERYVGLELPLRCRGPLELGAKACRLDENELAKVAARIAGNKVSEKLEEKIEEKLGDKVNPELRNAIKGLFNR